MFRCRSCGALNNVQAQHVGSPVCGRCKAALDISGTPQEVEGAALARVVDAATVPVLVDFWAPWCGPCRAASPIVDQFARENAGRLVALKLNTEQNSAAANSHGIQSIPTFVLFLNGREAGRQSGALPKAALAAWVAGITSKPAAEGGPREARKSDQP